MAKKQEEFELKLMKKSHQNEGEPGGNFLGTNEDHLSSGSSKLQVYSKRWLILTLSCLIQLIDQIIFLSLAPVANFSDAFYGEFSVNYLAMICTACSIPASIIAPWFGSRFTLRTVMLYPAWINSFGTICRMCSHIPYSSSRDGLLPIKVRFILVAVGQGLAATGTPFAVYQPSKIAAAWFPVDERALATTIGAISGMFGILVCNIMSPQLVHSPGDIQQLNLTVLIITLCTTVLTTVGVWRSAVPALPPSESAATSSLPFWIGLKKVLKQKDFLILLVVMGGAIGCFTCLYTLMEQILCSRGYTNEFAGLTIALLIGVGLVGGIGAGVITAKWQCFEEVVKISGSGGALLMIAFSLFSRYSDMQIYLAVSASIFGAFGMAFYGVGMDMGAECTHPVAETTSAGLIVLSGMVQFILYLIVLQIVKQPLPDHLKSIEKCTVLAHTGVDIQAHDMTIPLLVISGIITFHAILLTAFFKPKYERLIREKQKASQATLKENGDKNFFGDLI